MRKTESERSTIIVKQDIVNDIVEDFDGKYTVKQIEDILNSFWDNVTYYLKSSSVDNPVIVRPFFGLQFTSKITEEKEMDALGTTIKCSSRRRVKALFTRYYNRRKMNGFEA